MKFLEIIFGKVLDLFFKKDSGPGISIKNEGSSFQARDISNTNNSHNTTYQQTIIVNAPEEAAQPVSDIEIRHQNLWATIAHGLMFGCCTFFTILFSASSTDLYHKTEVFPKVFDNMQWISISSVIIGLALSKKVVTTINRTYNFIFSEDRKERLMVAFGSNSMQHKMCLTMALFIINAIIVYYIAKACFLIIF